MSELAGVALAAGAGTRLQPLTLLRPKALCPVGNVALLDRALDHLRAQTPVVAVNAHHHADQIVAHVAGRVHVSLEAPRALGTAGALGRLRHWIAGRDVLVCNADAYLTRGRGSLRSGDRQPATRDDPAPAAGPAAGAPEAASGALDALVAGWDHERCRLLVTEVPQAGDFIDTAGPVRYVGACLLPWRLVKTLSERPSGLYEVLWRAERAAGRLDLCRHRGTAIDCGTPEDYLRANLHAAGGRSVIGAGAVVAGTVVRCVVWPGAHVAADEHLVECVRAGSRANPLTVDAPLRRRRSA